MNGATASHFVERWQAQLSQSSLFDWSGLPLSMTSLAALAMALGWASGLRLYALIFLLSTTQYFDLIILPSGLQVLANPMVMALSGGLLFAEFFADKLVWLDSLWDSVHTFIRIPAGAALATALVGDQGGATPLIFALLGGGMAATTHFTKAGIRTAVNLSPEPASNILVSVFEDGLFASGILLFLYNPVLFIVLLVVGFALSLWLLIAIWQFIKRRRMVRSYGNTNVMIT